MTEKATYEDGMRDGLIKAIEDMQIRQNTRLDTHSRRIGNLERVAWILFAVIGVIQFAPAVKSFLGV